MQKGFSLVELSIVLVILGLLTGGILAGQNLIRAAELRAVSTEYNRYATAAQTFRDKYFAIPGDFRDATRFWGRLNSNSDCVTNSSASVATPGACDGNGNGQINYAGAANQAGEAFGYWQQLANAGLVEGNYPGTAGAGSGGNGIVGTNIPRSRLGLAGWHVSYIGNVAASNTVYFEGNYGNIYTFGATAGTGEPDGPVMSPEELWNIDTKMDDGLPQSGLVLSMESRPNCYDGLAYNLDDTGQQCVAIFKARF